ncbi:MAG: hypothetical protein ACRDLR_08130 [Gaiellaceae bacterium]
MRDTWTGVQSAFFTVVVIVAVVGVVGAVVSLLLHRRTWDGYGADHLVMESDARASARDEEIRQLLEARNARRARRGQPPVDVEAELARLGGGAAPAVDDELRDEIRQLVVARNHRRARRGEPPLDVDAEIAREIAELKFG